MAKQLVYAEAQIKNNALEIQPYNNDDDWSLTLKHDQFVGHKDAVWLVQKRGGEFYFVEISEEDVARYNLNNAAFLAHNAAAVRKKYRARRGYRFTTGPGVWCRRPDRRDVLWVAGHPRCRTRLDLALTLLNHRTRDIRRVKSINRIVPRDPERGIAEIGECGSLTPRGRGNFSAIFRGRKIDNQRQRIANVPWLITYSLSQGRWNLEIFATKRADYDEIADALIDNCGLYEFDLFAEMLIEPRRRKEKKTG